MDRSPPITGTDAGRPTIQRRTRHSAAAAPKGLQALVGLAGAAEITTPPAVGAGRRVLGDLREAVAFARAEWRVGFLLVLVIGWELYARHMANPLILPTFTETIDSLWQAIVQGPLLQRTATSLEI